MPKTKKPRKFCRLYKYVCAGCHRTKHRRHFARQGETVCPSCERKQEQLKNQTSLFDEPKEEVITKPNDENN